MSRMFLNANTIYKDSPPRCGSLYADHLGPYSIEINSFHEWKRLNSNHHNFVG